ARIPLPSEVITVTSPHRQVFVPVSAPEEGHFRVGAKEGTSNWYSGASSGPGLGVSMTGEGAIVAGTAVDFGSKAASSSPPVDATTSAPTPPAVPSSASPPTAAQLLEPVNAKKSRFAYAD